MAKRRSNGGRFSVTDERDGLESLDLALSAAIYLATRPGTPERTFYVREDGETRYFVSRSTSGVVTISPKEES